MKAKKPSERTIKLRLRELRKAIQDDRQDPIARRVAYAMETAVRWVTEETAGWESLKTEAMDTAKIIRMDLHMMDFNP